MTNGLPIGIAEGYVTAATCLELTGIPMVTAFTSENLEQVVVVLRQVLPNSSLIIFADNDRHLSLNKGVICAHKAVKRAQKNDHVLVPDFNSLPCARDYSDWNDLVQAIGFEEALKQIVQNLKNVRNEKIKQWIVAKVAEL